jgi:hypothetical protein
MSATITTTLPSRWDDDRGIWVGPEKIGAEASGSPDKVVSEQIVPHPDFPNGEFVALVDVYGDLYRGLHGDVTRFTRNSAHQLLGVNHKLI